MLRFNATLSLVTYNYLSTPGDYELIADVIDNTTLFYSGNVAPGNVIYMDGSQNGAPALMKFIVLDVIDNSSPPTVTINIRYIIPEGGPFDPIGASVIGEPNAKGIIQVPDATSQQIPTSLVAAIQNYQMDLLTSSGGTRIYNAGYTGSVDGVNAIFTPTRNFNPTTLEVYLNGNLQRHDIDYNIVGTTIVFTTIPSSDVLGSDTITLNLDPINTI